MSSFRSNPPQFSVSFEEIYRDSVEVVRKHVRRIVRCQHTTDDIVQDVFLIALQKLHTVRDVDKIPAWLVRIAINQATTHYRSKRQEALPELSAVDKARSPDDNASRSEHLAQVRHAVDSLPDCQRSAVHEFYYAGKMTKAIAMEQGIPNSTVRTRLHKARQTLAGVLS